MTTSGYLVEGMTCGSCVAKVLEKVRLLSGVTRVAMDLVPGGLSPFVVTSRATSGGDVVRAAVENAGFGLLQPGGREDHQRGSGPSFASSKRLKGSRT